MTDLTERLVALRERLTVLRDGDTLTAAIDRLTDLEAENARLREAAKEIADGCGWMYDDDPEYEPEPEDWWRVVRDLRAAARAALSDTKEATDGRP